MTNQIRISLQTLVRTIECALAAEGVTPHMAEIEAEVIAEADLLGVPSHGVRVLPMLVRALREGRANPTPHWQIVRDHAAACVLDADNGLGRSASVHAAARAAERARRFGIGACLAMRTTHWGRAHAYAYRLAQAGMIGICTTNAIPNMTAWGSPRPLLGNNPLAIGVPRGVGCDPIVLDMAMSQAALGKIGTYLREGKAAPGGWGLDTAGQPTTDPAAILASGLVLPMGEHKGAGLALMMELLTAALSGGPLSQEIVQQDASGLDPQASKLFVALDVEAFGERSRFEARVETLLAHLERAVESEGEFLYPGERGWQARQRHLAEGIPLHPQIVAQLAAVGIALPATE
jgi:LDH2 family malate/lactate/ureidoglycolate dehydrogenase